MREHMRLIDTNLWVSRIAEDHKLKHKYDRAVYIAAKKEVEIGCVKHGTYFWQQAYTHQTGGGCPNCANERRGNSQRTTQADFIKSSLEVDNEMYDHCLVNYINSTTKVDLVCNKEGHGTFSMLPLNRLRGQRCPKCAQESRTLKNLKSHEDFINQCIELNRDKVTYEQVVYLTDNLKVIFNCTEHREFTMLPSNFLQGQGCPACKKSGYRVNKPGYLYILSDNITTKVGITNRKPDLRAKEIRRAGGPKLDIIASYYFKDGGIALNLEKEIHRQLTLSYSQPVSVFGGSTECFLNVNIPALLSFVTPLASQTSEIV